MSLKTADSTNTVDLLIAGFADVGRSHCCFFVLLMDPLIVTGSQFISAKGGDTI